MRYFIQKISSYDDEQFHRLLPPEMIADLQRYSSPARRQEKAASYLLLIDALQQCHLYVEPPSILYHPSGKPYLANYPNIHFNLSHSKTHVSVALNLSSPVGIDVENIRKVSPSLIQRVCNDTEKETIRLSSNPTSEFLKLWTRKEAYLKYTGQGINNSLIDVPPQGNYTIETHPLPNADGWVSICYKP